MVKCPYCGKVLTHWERYCWHCENDLSEFKDKWEKPESEEDEG